MKTIRLIPGAFNNDLLQLTGSVKTSWSGETHEQFVDTLLTRLVDEDNQAIVLDGELKDSLMLIFRPTDERQRSGLKRELAQKDYALDESTVEAFALLFNVAQFSSYLATKDPTTQTSLISKPKRTPKKNTLKALLAQKPVVQEPEPTSPATPDDNTGPEEEETQPEPAPVAPAQMAMKKPAAVQK